MTGDQRRALRQEIDRKRREYIALHGAGAYDPRREYFTPPKDDQELVVVEDLGGQLSFADRSEPRDAERHGPT